MGARQGSPRAVNCRAINLAASPQPPERAAKQTACLPEGWNSNTHGSASCASQHRLVHAKLLLLQGVQELLQQRGLLHWGRVLLV